MTNNGIMKTMKRLLPTSLLLLLATCVIAQMTDVKKGKAIYEDNTVPSFTALVEPEPKWVKSAFKDYMKNTYDVSMKGIGFLANKDVLYAEEVMISILSMEPVNFYARIIGEGGKTRIDLFAEQGGEFFSQGSNKNYEKLKDILNHFLQNKLLNYYNDKIADLTDQENDLTSDIKDLEKDIADNKDDIAKMEREIIDKKSENEQLMLEIKELREKLDAHRKKLEEWKTKTEGVQKSLSKNQ